MRLQAEGSEEIEMMTRHQWLDQALHRESRHVMTRQQERANTLPASDDWGRELTTYLRCIIQQQCSGATIEYRRSDRSLDSAAREVDIGVHYPVGCREQFEGAVAVLGQYWSIHEATERPVYLTFLQWGGQTYCVHIYDEEKTSRSDGLSLLTGTTAAP
jgi:hypothetical protein